jgi:nucleotide-binding universal stress UspA family protein
MQTSPPIVVGVDGSEASLEALREAARLAGLLLGSVSSAVAAHATCPVLITHRGTLGPTR